MSCMIKHLPPYIHLISAEVKSMPEWHNRDFPVIAPLGHEKWDHDTPYPYASIIALEPKQSISAKPRPAIQVFSADGSECVSYGLLAVRDGYPLIVVKVPFPELMHYLRNAKKSISPLLNAKVNQKPWIHVKNWHEKDLEFFSDSDQFDAADAIKLIQQWGEWERDKKSWRSRMKRFWKGFNPGSLSARSAAENRFTKYCNAMGLERGDGKDFREPLEALYYALAFAQLVADRVKADQEVQ